MIEQEPIFSVSEFSNVLKGLVEGQFARVKIRGEISGLKNHSSGNCYFDLKESAGGKDFILACVLWKWTKISAKLEEGLEVILTGRATTYPGRSSYQLTVEDAEVAGMGALFKIVEERRKKLAAEGLFDAARKRPIPRFPRVIGVVTSETGAVINDIIHRISERFPLRIILYPCAVQGEGAEASIVAAIHGLNALGGDDRPDTIIVARGGGSLQDLMAFNSEEVVRAAAESAIPLISAVGHETDTTLIDFAADLRAPTPTAAAELATASKRELMQALTATGARVQNMMFRMLDNLKLRLEGASARLKNPLQLIGEVCQRIDEKFARIDTIVAHAFARMADRVTFAGKMIESFSFKNVLSRGYAIAWSGREVVESSVELARLGCATLELKDGKIEIFTGKKQLTLFE
jgi:exodeoxyribonuclease VII large subunit